MISAYRPAVLTLCLLVLCATTGCAHFRDAELRAQERAEARQAPLVAESTPQPAPTAAPAMPRLAVQEAPVQPVPAATPVPAPIAAPAPAASAAPATSDAIVIFANVPGAHCGACETMKISVAPSGQVLMEHGYWTNGHGDWRYRRTRAEVTPGRVAAFAASLSADRPAGTASIGTAGCGAPASGDDGLAIEWIEAERHDRLTVKFGCADGTSQEAERLRHAPDLLGLRQLALP